VISTKRTLPTWLCSVTVFCALLGWTSTASAVVIVGYTFTSSNVSPTIKDTNVTGGTFGPGGGLGAGYGMSTSGGNPTPAPFVRSNVTDEAVSSTSTDYVTFTVTANAGYKLNLTNFTFHYSYESQGGVTTPAKIATFTVRSSLDGFAANIGTPINRTVTGTGPSFATDANFSLSGATYQNLTGPFEIRIYFTDDSELANDVARIDNLMLNGDVVAIPEPSSLWLLAGGGLLGLAVRRRRRSH
jgi:hypothetical protein